MGLQIFACPDLTRIKVKTGGDPNPGTPKFASELKKKFSVPRGEGSRTVVMEASFEAWRPKKKFIAFLSFCS